MNNEIHFESETEMVNHAIDLYFSNVPERPYWLLIAFYLAAKKELQIVDGEVDPNILKLAQIDIWVNENSIKEESLEGTYYYGGELVTRNICSVYRDNELNFIINEFERAIFNEVTIFQSPQICEKKSKYIQNLYSVATILIGLSEEWFREEGSSTFDLILEKTISSFKDVLGNQIWLPKELSSLLANLLNYKNDGTIYNPFTNYCDISSILGKEALVYSVTNNPLVNALSLLRNYVRGNKNTRVRKFFNNSWHYLGQTDYLVACPPFGLKDEKGGEIAANFISNAIDSVNNTSVFVVTQGFLNSSSRYCIEVRKKLVESKAIETIINLPSNLLESTSTPLAILVLKKDRRNVGTEIFRFIDATNCCFKQNKKNLLDEFSVESLYDMSIVDPDYDRIIEFDKVDKSDYCLSMSYYLYKEGQDHRFAQCLVSLSRLGTFLNLPSFDYDIENINVVKIKDLSSSEDFQLEKNSKDFGIFEDNKREDYKVLSEDAVLISRFGTVKAVSYISNGDKVLLPSTIIAFKVNKDLIDSKYLVSELCKPYVKRQISLYDNIYYTIKLTFIENLKISVPNSLAYQIDAVRDIQEKKIKNLGIQIEQLKDAKYNEFEKNMHLRKHAMSHVIDEITPAINVLNRFLSSKKNNISISDTVSNRSGKTLEEYINSLKYHTDKLSKMLDRMVDSDTFHEASKVCVNDFIEKYCKLHLNDRYTIENNYAPTTVLIDGDEEQKDILKQYIYISEEDLSDVFNNIFDNALRHGFSDIERNDYRISISGAFSSINSTPSISITISNNGDGLIDGMTSEKMFHWGIGRHTGLGSWHVKNIVEHFGGQVRFNYCPDDSNGFKVSYELIFPLNFE